MKLEKVIKNCGKKALIGIFVAIGLISFQQAEAQTAKKPNILIIFGDDIGQSNISAYTHGLVGYQTPNIDRLGKEGTMFTDYYAENSCTAGRSTLITGQSCYRTGLSKVGMPGAPIGLQARDITIAQALKPLGYATGQFGKNHLGDLNKYLPTVHGFDEFFGNLYHLNAEEEPEDPSYPYKDSAFVKSYMVRGVLKCKATDRDDPTVDPRFGRVGKQTIEDSGPLTKKRMETIDDETFAAAIDFIKRQNADGKPFFCWMNATRMHAFTHVRESLRGKSGMSDNEYADGMLEHDTDVGLILKALDDLGIAENTIVIYTTDNGPNMFSWPDAAMSPFRSEKDSNWEGAFRVPAFVRWPGHIAAGKISNEILSGLDWFPTVLAAAGEPAIKEKLLTSYKSQGTTFKVHLDGFNQLPYLTGQQPKSARTEFYYFNDDAELVSMRMNDWKIVFQEQRTQGGFGIWANPFTPLRVPKLFNLRMDPYERADITSFVYEKWWGTKMYIVAEGIQKGAAFLESFVTYPPSQDPASFSINDISENVKDQIKMIRSQQQNAVRK
ncbi:MULTISPECIES: arylsulfatase [unclassified Flavobacterium]|uniref:arylsulfatase n=1 Tax=unclassified Flavobacterium TaxID=196869 RepID=UPI0006ABBB9F|nr:MULTISPECIES: arylsulfatase [unclassified Flavobacterium]OWU92804.1 arylsulfatase [Flavobacterium sp. NLM]